MTDGIAKYELVAIDKAITAAKYPLKKSSTLLVGGLIGVFIGMAMAESGRQQQITAALRGSVSSGSGLTSFGSILTLVGAIVALVGLARLAAAVDRTAILTDAVLALTLRVEELADRDDDD